MFILFWQGFVNTILHYTLTFNTDIDRFVFIFLLIDLFIAAVACLIRDLEKNYKIMDNVIEQFNNHLAKRNEIIDNVRKGFVFQKLRSCYYGILYFKVIDIKAQVEIIQKDLINFGVDEQIVKDDGKLLTFLQEVGQNKYQIQVNEKEKKFIFIRKEEDDTNSTKS